MPPFRSSNARAALVSSALFALVLATGLIAAPGPGVARGGGHGSGGGGHVAGGKSHLAANPASGKSKGGEPGAERETGDSKNSGAEKPVNVSAKPDSDTAATTRPPGRKKR